MTKLRGFGEKGSDGETYFNWKQISQKRDNFYILEATFIRLWDIEFYWRRLLFPGNYSCLAAKFELHRSIGFHLVQSYIPTILIVIVSWVSFWMDVEHVPGRVALGVTTLLTISSKSAGLSSETPQGKA